MIRCRIQPERCDLPHRVTHPEKLAALTQTFRARGWDPNHPILVGYWQGSRVQLITGTHRAAAAAANRLPIPIVIFPEEYVRHVWGTDDWRLVVEAGNR